MSGLYSSYKDHIIHKEGKNSKYYNEKKNKKCVKQKEIESVIFNVENLIKILRFLQKRNR